MHRNSSLIRFGSIFIVLTAILGILPGCLLRREGRTSNWLVFKKAVDGFIALPSMENSRRLLKALPEKSAGAVLDYQEDAFRYLFEATYLNENGLEGWERFPILEYELWAGNPNIIQLALRLYEYAEYPNSLKLCASISTLIRIHPKPFLDALDEKKQDLEPSMLSYLLTCLPQDYFLTTQAQLQELSMRIKALERVKSDRLAPLRDNCRAILKKQIEEIELAPLLIWPVSEHYEEEPPESVKTAFEEFVRCPSMGNARAFRDSIPLNEQKGYTDKIQHLIFLGRRRVERSLGYLVLEREAVAGNRYAAEALFRMYNISPGGIDTLELLASLSKLIRINPRLFLETFYSYKDMLDLEWKEGLVRFLPVQFREKRHVIHEYKMRQEALAGVAAPFLREIREYCVGTLGEAIRLRTRRSP